MNALLGRKRAKSAAPSKKRSSKPAAHALATSVLDPFSTELPACIADTCDYLEKNGLKEEGLFRVPGFMNDVRELKKVYDKGQRPDLSASKGLATVASLLKHYLSELSEPLLTFELIDCFMLAVDVSVAENGIAEAKVDVNLNAIRSCLRLLPPANITILRRITSLFVNITNNSDVNNMTPSNIATCISPVIMRREEDPSDVQIFLEESKKIHTLITTLISQYEILFENKPIAAPAGPTRAADEEKLNAELRRGSIRLASSLLRREKERSESLQSSTVAEELAHMGSRGTDSKEQGEAMRREEEEEAKKQREEIARRQKAEKVEAAEQARLAAEEEKRVLAELEALEKEAERLRALKKQEEERIQREADEAEREALEKKLAAEKLKEKQEVERREKLKAKQEAERREREKRRLLAEKERLAKVKTEALKKKAEEDAAIKAKAELQVLSAEGGMKVIRRASHRVESVTVGVSSPKAERKLNDKGKEAAAIAGVQEISQILSQNSPMPLRNARRGRGRGRGRGGLPAGRGKLLNVPVGNKPRPASATPLRPRGGRGVGMAARGNGQVVRGNGRGGRGRGRGGGRGRGSPNAGRKSTSVVPSGNQSPARQPRKVLSTMVANGQQRKGSGDSKDVAALAKLLMAGRMTDANALLQQQYVVPEGYKGELRNGRPHGKGSLLFPNGDLYEGDFNDGQRHGNGELRLSNGDSYRGEFVKGIRHGKGSYVDRLGNKYDGEYVNGRRCGQGIQLYASGIIYEGEFKDGRANGKGRTIYSNQDEYIGWHKSDHPHGYGEFVGKKGGHYTGFYKEGLRHGKGRLLSVSGNKYEGEFDENNMHGIGRYTFSSGDVYEGEFVQGKFCGVGRYSFYPAGSAEMTGRFADGQCEEEMEIDAPSLLKKVKRAIDLSIVPTTLPEDILIRHSGMSPSLQQLEQR